MMLCRLSLIQERLQLFQQNEEKANLILCRHFLEPLIGLELLDIQVNILVFRDNISASIL